MLSTETDDSDQNDPEVFRSYRKKKAALKGLLYKFKVYFVYYHYFINACMINNNLEYRNYCFFNLIIKLNIRSIVHFNEYLFMFFS